MKFLKKLVSFVKNSGVFYNDNGILGLETQDTTKLTVPK